MTDYETVAAQWDTIVETYLKACAEKEANPIRIRYNGYPTTQRLLDLYLDKELAVAKLLADHGWTLAAFEAEITARYDAKES